MPTILLPPTALVGCAPLLTGQRARLGSAGLQGATGHVRSSVHMVHDAHFIPAKSRPQQYAEALVILKGEVGSRGVSQIGWQTGRARQL